MKIYIGRADCKPMNSIISGLGRPCKGRTFKSHKDARKFQNHLKKVDSKGLFNGDYTYDISYSK